MADIFDDFTKKRKKVEFDFDKMGVDIDKNEFKEIILSNSNHPEVIERK